MVERAKTPVSGWVRLEVPILMTIVSDIVGKFTNINQSLHCDRYSRRKKEQGRRKKEQAITSRVWGIKNVLTVEVAISTEVRISGGL
jgi:hypothetical protein